MLSRRRRKRGRRGFGGPTARDFAIIMPLFLFFSLALLGMAAAGLAIVTYQRYEVGLPDVKALADLSLPATTRVYDRTGTHLLALVYNQDRDPVAYADIPATLVMATVDTEDRTFWTNPGVDFIGTVRALLNNASGGSTQGGSTITQQLVKQLLVGDSVTYDRKIREAILATRLSTSISKQDLITLYLNENYYGEQAYGVSAAARRYFGLPLGQLNLGQISLMAGLTQAPSALDPFDNPAGAAARQRVILDAMVRAGDISPDQETRALAAPWNLVPYHDPVSPAPAFTIAAISDAAAAVGGLDKLEICGCTVITTLDMSLQALAQRDLTNFIKSTPKADNVHDGALVAEDPATGEILAYVGSANYADNSAKVRGQFDAAGNAYRSPGSAWKGITYLAAMEYGHLSAASLVWDVPTTFAKGYTPHDYFPDVNGPITIRQAIRESRNIPAIRTMMANGGPTVMASMATRLGIVTKFNPAALGPSTAIGTTSVTLTEMTAAYSTIDALGLKVTQHKLISIATNTGVSLYSAKVAIAKPASVVDPKLTYELVDMLKDNASKSGSWLTGARADIGRPAAIKTGTENDLKDTYAMGLIPQLAVGVWVGNADDSPMGPTFHSFNGPLVIWRNFTLDAIKNKGYKPVDWTRPAGLVHQSLCTNKAMYGGYGIPEAVPGCPFGTNFEWVIPGFNDSGYQLAHHGQLAGTLPTDGAGKLVDASCPTAVMVKGILAKAELPAWQADLNRWVASAAAGRQNSGGRFAWQSYHWIGLGGTCPAAPTPTPSPSASPSPEPTPSAPPPSAPAPTPTPITP
jgi:membrane peptidoglycan carboxypeptidase